MAHRKKIELFVDVNNEKDFHSILHKNMDKLICAEIYCEFSGYCSALERLFTKIKLDWSDGKLVLLRVLADAIEEFERFRNQSEPLFIFITGNKITKVFRGVDAIKFGDVAKDQLVLFKRQEAGEFIDRPTYDLDEATPEEKQCKLQQETDFESRACVSLYADATHASKCKDESSKTILGELTVVINQWRAVVKADLDREAAWLEVARSTQLSLRKRRRAELMVEHLSNLNFVLFWPHAKRAHVELYERWDMNDIMMVAREEIVLDEYTARDLLYNGDAPVNEASMHALLAGPALAICFRLLGSGSFVDLVRRILYEDIPPLDPAKSHKEQAILKTAFDQYKSYSPTREEVWRQRREEKERLREEKREKRARRLSEMQRLARQAIVDEQITKKNEREQLELDFLKSGNLTALHELKQQPQDEGTDIVMPETLSDEAEESDEDIEDENEYFPPPGLLVPGFYAPPNDIAKANGLAILFPNLVSEKVTPEQEFLPPHVLVLLEINKRHRAIEALIPHRAAVIHMGIFRGSGPSNAVHVSYSVAQYNKLGITDEEQMKIAFMLSMKSDLPLLELMDLFPAHVSRDERAGERECARLFPVYYCHEAEFEDFARASVQE